MFRRSSYQRKALPGLVGLTAVGVVAALLAGGPAQASPTPASAASAVRIAPPQLVRLVTGDTVRVATLPDGRQTASVIKLQKSGPGSVFQSFNRGGDLFVVPQSAVPYLGSRLDLRLFDVTRLAQHPDSALALTVHLRSGASAAAMPGFSVRDRTGSAVTGSLSPRSAEAFGRALARQATRDHSSPTHDSGLFRGIARISPAAHWTVDQHAAPASDLHTLTVNATDWAGNPDNGDSMTIYNVDDLNVYNGYVTFSGGTAQQQVPNGHYAGVAFFYDYSSGTIYQVTLAQFKVKGDTTVSVDARDATSKVSITTPRPSAPMAEALEVARADANGLIGSFSFNAGDQTFYVKPIGRAPTVGKLYYWVYTRNFSTGSPKTPYTYDLKYGSTGKIKKDQSYAPDASTLAAVNSLYGADHDGQQSLDARFAVFPWEQFALASDIAFTTPLRRIEYYNADRNLMFSGVDYQVYVPDPFTLVGEIDSSWRTYKGGYRATEPWGDDPAHPRLLQHDIYVNQVACPACLEGQTKTLDALAFPFGDNSEEHRTYPDSGVSGLSETSNWTVKADKAVVSQGTGVLQAAAGVGSAEKFYQIAYATTRSSSDFTLSTATHTVWRVPVNAPQVDLPAGWTCTLSGGTDCTVLPLITVDYNLPSNLLGQIPAGDAVGSMTVGHLADAPVDVSRLSVKVSYDGGSTYSTVKVHDNGDGTYSLSFTVPKPGRTDGYGSLLVKAKDANGSAFTESITDAFAVVS